MLKYILSIYIIVYKYILYIKLLYIIYLKFVDYYISRLLYYILNYRIL